jgi:hypothetical protein
MEQRLAAVRLRLDNLLIKQSIFDRLEPHAAETKGAMPLTCDIWGFLRKRPGQPRVYPGFAGNWRCVVLPVIAAIFPLRKVAG